MVMYGVLNNQQEWVTFVFIQGSIKVGYSCLHSRHINKSLSYFEWITNSFTLAWIVSSVLWIIVVFFSPDGLTFHHFEHQTIWGNTRTCTKVWALSSCLLDYLQHQFFNFTDFNFSNKMIPDINVFGSLMIHLVFRQIYITLAITKHYTYTLV